MKKISIISVFAGLFMGLVSCENDTDPVASAQGLLLRKDAAVVTPSELNPTIDANSCIKLDWEKANNGVSTASTYQIIISDHDVPFIPDGEGKNVVVFNWVTPENPNNRTYKALNSEVNNWMNQLPSFNCGTMNIDFRIRSLLGNNEENNNNIVQYSNPITVAIKGYPKDPLIFALVKTGASPESSAKIVTSAYTTNTDYEGFMYLEAGDYKFYQPDACGSFASATVFGISGGNSGTLESGGTTSYNVPTAGHYFVTVNGQDSSYKILPFNNASGTNVFGIFGNATKTFGFSTTTPMDYDFSTKKWKVTLNLIDGRKFSFKTGNTSPVAAVLVGTGAASVSNSNALTTSAAPIDNTGSVKAPGTYVNDNTKTKYDIELDLSVPRQYSYTLKVSPN
ncbi:hypothetical protein KIH23_07875 [Flavobacterium sp. CYK-55]|uniref:hypothetical protein n=1 Tax=Flavobacterium sp. CYK-55 TaxID=2835529 RepID=UPI001BCD8DD2|nr:hypothetical protein [Flavobacterium sp. CYK-55]MBS7787213.1 hypothetical protein [Flavobacterium sp. CYK-55]